MRPAVAAAQQQLIDQLIARGALWSRRLIEAFRATPRHLFLDRFYYYRRQGGWREVCTRTVGRAELRWPYSDRALTTRLSQATPDRRVDFCHGDGRAGWPERAPFDRIEVTAATPDLEPAWLEQLRPGGLLLAPLELAPGLAYLVCGRVSAGRFEGRLTRPAYFMP